MIVAESWTKADRARLAQLHRSGVPIKEIAAALGRTKWATQAQIKVLQAQGYEFHIRRPPRKDPPALRDDAGEELARAALANEAHLADLRASGRGAWRTMT